MTALLEHDLTVQQRHTANAWWIALHQWQTHTVSERYGLPARSSTGFTIIGSTRARIPGTGTHTTRYVITPAGNIEVRDLIRTIQNAPLEHLTWLNNARMKQGPHTLLRPNTNEWNHPERHEIPAMAQACVWLAENLTSNRPETILKP